MTEEPRQEDRGAQENQQKGVRALLVGAAIAGAVLLVIGLWAFVGPSTTTEKKDFVQAVGVLLAGLVGLIGLLLTWRNQRLTQRSLEDTRRNTQEQLRLTEQGQITERFTRAIDQLGATDDDGNPRLEIRLGGIYALERIDKESPERAYHSTVMEVLTAYVRENAPWPPKSSKSQERDFMKPPEGGSVSNSAPNKATEQDEGAEQGVEPILGTPRTDIQAVLDVLNRREEDRVPEKHRVILDLRGTNLKGANLFGTNLKWANLKRANLEEANLHRANLQEANLQRADLREANLQEALLLKADLQGARLHVARPYGSLRPGAGGANLIAADLQEANLYRADLQGANFEQAYLERADLSEAHGLAQEQIEWTVGRNEPNEQFGRNETKLPEGLNRPQLWNKSPEEQWEIVQERLRGH
jgi:hypothetical protein